MEVNFRDRREKHLFSPLPEYAQCLWLSNITFLYPQPALYSRVVKVTKVSYFPICQWTNRKSAPKVIAISDGQLLVLKGDAALTIQLTQATFGSGGGGSQRHRARWRVLGLQNTVCRTMAANSKSHHNHINEINQCISSSQMSGWQGGTQPSLVINFCGGQGERIKCII